MKEAMKGRVGANGGAPTDLLVCFPSRAHLTLMPKPICSPSRVTEAGKRHPARPAKRGQASPLFSTESKHMSSEIAEPTSPKVTCAGQIKVRPKPRARPRPPGGGGGGEKNWLQVVEEIERLHKHRKKPHWLDALGLKKDVMHFLGALRGLRFGMHCFGSFHGTVDCTTDEEEDGEEEEDEEEEDGEGSGTRTIFSKWFMVLEEDQGVGGLNKRVEVEAEEEEEEEEMIRRSGSFAESSAHAPVPPSSVPPPNALLLMRCRSAPANGWLEEQGEELEGGGRGLEEAMTAQLIKEEEKEKERLLLMSYAPDFFKISTDIAKETWVVSSMDPLARSRSWKR